MNRLQGKVAIITGGALGIGAACATRMAQEGARVAILDVHETTGEALAMQLRDGGFEARFWRCDVSREAEVSATVTATVGHFGRLDILVNNAGIAGANKPTHEPSAPAGKATRNTGRLVAACTSETMMGDMVNDVINHPLPTFCIQVPV